MDERRRKLEIRDAKRPQEPADESSSPSPPVRSSRQPPSRSILSDTYTTMVKLRQAAVQLQLGIHNDDTVVGMYNGNNRQSSGDQDMGEHEGMGEQGMGSKAWGSSRQLMALGRTR